MSDNKKKAFAILLDPDDVDAVKELQEIERSSFSFMIRKCVRIGIEQIKEDYISKGLLKKR